MLPLPVVQFGLMMKCGCFMLFFAWRFLLQMPDRFIHIKKQLFQQILGNTVADKDPLDHHVFTIWRQGICRNQPTAIPETVSQVVQIKFYIGILFKFPADTGNTDIILAAGNDIKNLEFFQFFGKEKPGIITCFLNSCITFFSRRK